MKNQLSAIGFVVVNTKSNYKNLNGKHLPLFELMGDRVTAITYSEELGKHITIDFKLSETISIHITGEDVRYANEILKYNFNFNLPLSN